MLTTVVVPFSRIENAGLVLANFARQRHTEKRLLLVANGAAEGILAVPGAFVCKSEPSPAHARNAGLRWVRERGGGAVAFFDDDDYYGPDYLTEVSSALAARRATAKAVRYVRWADGLYYCLAEQQAPTHGPTISGFAEHLPDFPLVHLEDAQYSRVLERAGVELRTLGPRHYVYNRTSDERRECAVSKAQFLRAFGPAVRIGDVPDATADLAVPQGERVPTPTWEELFDELERLAPIRSLDP